MNAFVVKSFKVNCCQPCVKVLDLVETSDVQVSALCSHCATDYKLKEQPSFVVNFLYPMNKIGTLSAAC